MAADVKQQEPREGNEADSPDIGTIMAEIRARVRADVEANRDKQKAFRPANADFNTVRKAGEMLHSEELRYLNTNYAFGPRLNLDSVTSHRPGIIGKTIVRFKRKLLTVVWDLLKDYFGAEREFHANLVRFLNDFTKYADARDASNFWELIRKIDYDVTKALERIERIGDEQMASLRSSERRVFDELYKGLTELQERITRLDGARERHDDQLRTLDSVTRGLEGIIARLKAPVAVPAAPTAPAQGEPPNFSYLLLENRYRGSEEEIRERLALYVSLLKGMPGRVVELGPGRGELLQLFSEAGVAAYGVDIDAAMAEQCRERGLEVSLGGVDHLRALPERSIGGLIAVQVVEHLPRTELEELLRLCAAKVKKGGRIIFETVNPRSLLALSSHFFRDPTHVWPLHPDTLGYAMTLAGLKLLEVRELSPAGGQLRTVPLEDYMTPRWAHTLELLNGNIKQLNELLYGFMDYCIIAEAQ